MLKIYLTSVIIYMIIIYCTCSIFADGIRAKGWISEQKSKSKLGALFTLSAVPILRFFVVVLILYMATHTKEQFNKWYKEVQEKKEELENEQSN